MKADPNDRLIEVKRGPDGRLYCEFVTEHRSRAWQRVLIVTIGGEPYFVGFIVAVDENAALRAATRFVKDRK